MEPEEVKQERRLVVEGTPYLIPPLDTFDMDEAMTMYRYSDLTFDQIFDLEGLHPGVVAGLLHVAIQRSDPSLRVAEVKDIVRRVNMMDIMEQLAALADDAPDPSQAAVPSPDDDSSKSKLDPIEPSGSDSRASSDPDQEQSSHVSTGIPDSATPATSDQKISAV